MITKGLIVITTQGFGNRLKIIASSKILSDYLKIPLFICWEETPDCNIKFSDVFEPCNNINEITLDEFKDTKYVFFGRVHTNSIFDNIMEVYNDKQNSFEYLLIEGGHEFKYKEIQRLRFLQEKQSFYNSLIFKENIKERVNNFLEEVGEEYITIHYRDINEQFDSLDIKHNDVVNFVQNSPIDKFLEIVDKLKSDLPIVIISNTDKFYKEFCKKYKSKTNVFTTGIVLCDRSENKDMISSIIDFNLLCRSSIIIGNYFSSFSDEASFFKLIPKITPLSDKLLENIQTTVNNYHCLNYSFIDNIAAVNFNDNLLIKHLQI